MALKPPPTIKSQSPSTQPTEEQIKRVISGGGSTRGDAAPLEPIQAASSRSKDVAFTMSISPELAALIDAHRRASKTSRRAWLLQAAEERLKREGLM